MVRSQYKIVRSAFPLDAFLTGFTKIAPDIPTLTPSNTIC